MSIAGQQVPPPLDWVVLKVAQLCNIDCDYCYVYNRGDLVWRERPRFISEQVLHDLAGRINTCVRQSAHDRFVVELHGGEPLLLGKERMRRLIQLLRAECPDVTLKFHLQTNGLLLDEEWCVLFEEEQVRIGVSLDGPPELADRHRVDRQGRGTTRRVIDNLARLRVTSPSFANIFSGVLCVIDPVANGGEMVDWFLEHGFGAFDFLLPDGNYVNLPQGWTGPEAYLAFLTSAFERWYELGAAAPSIRTFEIIMRAFIGVQPDLDAFGGDLRRICVVETNGAIGLSDTVRMCGGKYAQDLFYVSTSDLKDPGQYFDVASLQKPCTTCQKCPAFRACGGGYLPHRYDGYGFDNPSIYCNVLYKLVERIYGQMREDIPAELWVRG
ncbi:radical SAM protein [Kitasatospora sp. NPDC017646]|uniref:radical SAM protein n=1 Tax=Kitasatospora sp. NPDC017646 TaxID=3364024 RepID=UPI00378B58A3